MQNHVQVHVMCIGVKCSPFRRMFSIGPLCPPNSPFWLLSSKMFSNWTFWENQRGDPWVFLKIRRFWYFFLWKITIFKKYYWTLKEIIIKKVINCWFALHGALPWDKIFELKNYKNKSKNNTKGGPLDEFEFATCPPNVLQILNLFSRMENTVLLTENP